MVLIANKRGMFFTIFVIIVLSLFALSFVLFSDIKERKTIQNRVTSLNNFVFSVEEDIPRQLKISTFRIIFLLEKRIIDSNSFIPDVHYAFEELFFNGTINNGSSAEIDSIMTGAKFSDIQSSLQQKANKINADIIITSPSINIFQEDPWRIKLTFASNIIIKDVSNLAVWNKTSNITVYISIENFEDPLYTKNTGSALTNKIVKSPYQSFSNSNELLNHAVNSYYISSTDAPSFLDRLEGKTSPNQNGIESLIYIPNLPSAVSGRSIVDHVYFSSSPAYGSQVSGMPSWFLIDSSHQGIYHF